MQYRNIARILRHCSNIVAALQQYMDVRVLFPYCYNIVEQYIRRINVAI